MHSFESTVPTELRFVVNLRLLLNTMFETRTAFTLCQLILSPALGTLRGLESLITFIRIHMSLMAWTSDFGWLLRSELPQRRENFTSLYSRNLNHLILKQDRQFLP